MINKMPSLGFSSILSSKTVSSGKSLGSIIKDLNKMNKTSADGTTKKMSFNKKNNIAKTIYKMNTNPNAVVTSKMSKSVIKALVDAGHVKPIYTSNLGSAIVKVRKAHLQEVTSGADDKKRELTPIEKRRDEISKKRQAGRLQELAREHRAEAEEKHEAQVGAQVYSLDAKKRRAKVSVNDSKTQSESSRVSVTPASAVKSDEAVDIMLDAA